MNKEQSKKGQVIFDVLFAKKNVMVKYLSYKNKDEFVNNIKEQGYRILAIYCDSRDVVFRQCRVYFNKEEDNI